MGTIKLVKGSKRKSEAVGAVKLESEPLTMLDPDDVDDEHDDIDGMDEADRDEDELIDDDEPEESTARMSKVSDAKHGTTSKPPAKGKQLKDAKGRKGEPVAVAKKTSAKASAKKTVKTPAKRVVAKATPVKTSAKKSVITKAQAQLITKSKAKVRTAKDGSHRGGSEAGRKLKEFKPHYWTATSPFRPGSKLQKIVDVLDSKGTVKLAQLKAHVEKQKMNLRGVLNNLRKQASFNGEWRWKFENKDGVVTFAYTHKPSAAFKKLAGEPVRADAVAAKKIKRAA